MNIERIPGTQATLFNELANGQKLLFNGVPSKRGKSIAVLQSLLESVAQDIADRATLPTTGQKQLF